MDNIKQKVFSGIIWRFAERIGAQGVNFIVSLVLARILSPTDYGTVALINVFITIAYVFISSGFGTALIQKKDADELDFSSVFFFNVFVAVLSYGILFLFAPLIADFYNNHDLIKIIRVLGITLIVGGINGIQEAIISKTMQFKKFFYATSIGTLLSAAIGIALALKGAGAWAIVGQQLSNQCIDTVVLWFTTKWYPKVQISLTRLKNLFAYGWRILVSSLLDSIYNNIYSLVIGKYYSSAELAFYNKGNSFPSLIVSNVNSTIDSVLFPALSSVQEEKSQVKGMVKRSIKTSVFLIFPAMAGMAGVSKGIVTLLLTEKWLPCVPYVCFSCFIFAVWPLHTANLQAVKALGRSDMFLKAEIQKKIVGVSSLIIMIPFGVIAMMIGRCVSTVISLYINTRPTKALLNYGMSEQIRDIMPALMNSIIMMIAVLLLDALPIGLIPKLLIQVLVGVLMYVGLAYVFRNDSLFYIMSLIRDRRKEKA